MKRGSSSEQREGGLAPSFLFALGWRRGLRRGADVNLGGKALKLQRLPQRFPLRRQGGAKETLQLFLLSWGQGWLTLVANLEFQRAQPVLHSHRLGGTERK